MRSVNIRKSIPVLSIVPFDQQYLSNVLLNELTDGDSTTYPGKLFHKYLYRKEISSDVSFTLLCPD